MQSATAEVFFPVTEPDDDVNQQILDATFELFSQNGIRHTSFDDIARHAKVGRATVFRRVKDKQQLLKMLMQRELGRFVLSVRQHSEHLEEPKDRFTQGFIQAIRLAHANPMLQGLMRSDPEEILPQICFGGSAFLTFAYEYLLLELRKAQEEKGFLQGKDLEVVAEGLVRLMQSFIAAPSLQNDVLDEQRLQDFFQVFIEPVLK